MRFAVNNLIQFIKDEDGSVIERVLYVSLDRDEIAMIEVDNPVADPTWRKYRDIATALEHHDATLLEIDSYTPPSINEVELKSPEAKKIKEHAERDWIYIEPLVTGDNAVKIFFPRERALLLKKRAIELKEKFGKGTGISTKSLRRKVRRFWQRGQTPHAVMADYKNCGGAGRERKAGEKKRGTPSKISRVENRPTGVNVDDHWEAIILKGCNTFYLNRDKKNFHYAYIQTLRLFCSKGIDKDTGKPILPDPNSNEVFTENQFKYYCQKYIKDNLGRALVKRHGQRRFDLRYRDLKGNSTSQALWPGALYQIDATIADVYLVSPLNRKHILKRPIIWLVSDVFSRMIVGMCIRFEGEGWLGLKLALENTTANKIAYCSDYGINISEEMWPACFLPDHITGDRGPLLSHNADYLAFYLNIHISNTPPYRPDWKGIIEQMFNQMNIRVIHGLPGAVAPEHERGDKDYRLSAVLTLRDLTEIIISTVLYYNNHHRIESYPLDKDMIGDHVQPYPSELYFWGIDNLSGSPRFKDRETIRLALLPEGQATITAEGIKFGPNFYTCEYAEKHAWRLKARNYGSWKERVGFDPRCGDIIYLRLKDAPSIPCHINKSSPFKGCDWIEINSYNDEKGLAASRAIHRDLQALSDHNSDVEAIVAKAIKKTQDALIVASDESNRSRIKNMRTRTKEEIERIHQAEADEILSEGINASPHHEVSENITSAKPDNDYVPIPQPANVRDIRERILKDAHKEK